MAVYSMTGYASAQLSPGTSPASHDGGKTATHPGAGLRLGLEIRSVNSRFLDLSFRLGEELRSHEPALRELISSRVKRGKVEVRGGVEGAGAELVREPSMATLQRLAAVQDTVRTWMPDAPALSVAEILRLAAAESSTGVDWGDGLMKIAAEALGELVAAREREGARLVKMLLGHLGQLRTLAEQARPLVPQLVEQQRQRFLERWKEAMALSEGAVAHDAAQDRALTEATSFAIRIDVAEELTRLAAHLDEIERLIKKGGEVGKRLDFLIQELHREANTLGSKSALLELTRISVDMKVLIEQMREQVQNLE
ncbi:YicC/YloC family endoribonuclease [Ramlibacter sp.]|uniref:YicC/YloC family endoribonuclease n=1 Tax=Ramlibacter sp. TaxID=1917967 RepID=UPI002FC9BB0C